MEHDISKHIKGRRTLPNESAFTIFGKHLFSSRIKEGPLAANTGAVSFGNALKGYN